MALGAVIVCFAAIVVLSAMFLLGKDGAQVSIGGTESNPVSVPPAFFESKSQEFAIDQSTLDQIASGNKNEVAVSLFDGEVVHVKFDRREAIGDSGATVFGKIKNEPDSRVHMSIVENAMFGEIRLEDGRVFSIGFVPGGKFKLSEVNTSVDMHHPGADKGPEYIVVNGKKERVARCYGTVVAKSDFPQVRMLASKDWMPSLKIFETLNEEEQFVAQRTRIRRSNVRGLKRTAGPRTAKPLVNVLTGTGSNQRLKTRLGGRTPQSNPRNSNAKPLGTLIGLQNQSATPTQQQQQGGASTNQFVILVLYTPKAGTKIGSAAAVKAKAASYVAGFNSSLKDSGVSETAVLAPDSHQVSQEFLGSQLSDCLKFLRTDSQVKAWRDQYKADLVNCIIDNGGGAAWGMAYLPGSSSAIWNTVPGTTFSHEVGHNLGCGHGGSNGGGLHSYSNGNHFTGTDGKGYRTIMAYSKAGFTTRVDVYSGPNVQYKGAITGQAGQTDNAKTLRERIPIAKKNR